MCSSPECRVEILPDGQIDETHVFTDEQMSHLAASVRKLGKRLHLASIAHAYPQEVWPTDLRLRGWGKGGTDGQ